MIEPNPKLLRQYLGGDARLMPLRNWQALTKDGLKAGKLPVDFKWQEKDYNPEDMLRHMQHGENVGFKVGYGWGVLDFDPRNDLDDNGEPRERASWTIWRVLADFKIRPGEYACVETGGGGLHIYMRIPSGYVGREKITEKYGKGVEWKTSPRRYVVAAGSVHPGQNGEPLEGNYYLWGEGSAPLENTCDAPEEMLEAFKHQAPKAHLQGEGEEGFGRFTPAQLEEILSHFPVEDFGTTGQHDWFNFMCACHWFTGGEGREEFIDWSTGDPIYSEQDNVIRDRWDSLGEKVGSIKSGFVFKLLKEYGVEETAWPRERTSSAFELPDFEELELTQEPSSKEAKIMRRMNKDHAFVMVGGEGFVSRYAYSSARPDPYVQFSSVRNMQHEYANKRTTTMMASASGEKLTEITHFDYWFRSPERREYKGVDFMPEEAAEYMTPAGLYMNLWQGWPFDVNHGRGNGEWSKLRELIKAVVANNNEEHFEYILKWMAYSIQRARGPQGVAMVMRGPKGIGKSILAEVWCRLFGNHSLITDDDNDVFGQFNERMATTCALFLDEALWAGDKSKLGKVKTRITQPQVRVEQKFQPARSVSNHLKLMMATNEDWAVPATEGERRFVVFDCQRVWPKRSPFFGELKDELYGKSRNQTHGLRAMFYDLATMDIRGWHPEANQVQTDGLGDQVRQGFGDTGEWWYEILNRGSIPHMFDPDPQARRDGPLANWESRPVAVPMTSLRDSLDAYLGTKPRGELGFNFRQRYVSYILRMMPETVAKGMRLTPPEDEAFMDVERSSRGSTNCFVFPPLPEMQQHLADLFGLSFDQDDNRWDTTPTDGLDVDDLV